MGASSQERISRCRRPREEHANAPIGVEPVPVQRALLERLGPRCLMARAEPHREAGSSSLIALALALVGGIVTWPTARQWMG
jgi:hypothetical protein